MNDFLHACLYAFQKEYILLNFYEFLCEFIFEFLCYLYILTKFHMNLCYSMN